jgi:hypothetical protein
MISLYTGKTERKKKKRMNGTKKGRKITKKNTKIILKSRHWK